MKTIQMVAMILFTTVSLNSCTPKMTFSTSTIVPAATGTVNVKKDKNKNYVISVNVQNLAEPKNLSPSRNTYLVWMESNESSAKKLGQLIPNGKVLKATLNATATDAPRVVFITAEDNVEAQFPDSQVILTTQR